MKSFYLPQLKISKIFCQNNHFQLYDDNSFTQKQIIGVCTRKECKEKLVCVECQDIEYINLNNFQILKFQLNFQFINNLKIYHPITFHKDHIGMILSYQQLKDLVNQKQSDISDSSLNAEMLKQQFLCLYKELLDSIKKVEMQFNESFIIYHQLEQTQNIIQLIKQDRYYEISNEQFMVFFQVVNDQALDCQYQFKLAKNKLETSIECLEKLNTSLQNQPQQYNIQNIINQHISLNKIKQFYLQNPLNFSQLPPELNCQKVGQIKEFKNQNEIYYGEVDDKQQKHGKGIQIQKKGDIIYEGIWQENQFRWGQKTQFNEQQECIILRGYMRDKKLNGQGTKMISSGDVYEGQFFDDKLNGEGYSETSDGEKYTGGFKDNKRHGQGELQNKDGEIYIGSFKNGKKNGDGFQNLKNGDNYQGWFQDDKFHGKGVYTVKKDNQKFIGIFRIIKKMEILKQFIMIILWKLECFKMIQEMDNLDFILLINRYH